MSNATGAFGLRYVSGPKQIVTCYLAASYATALYKGDPVVLSNEADDRDTAGFYPAVEKATLTDGGIWFGVIDSFIPIASDLSKQYHPASTEQYVNVILGNPQTVFEIRGDGQGTPTKLFVGLNAVGIQGTASTVFGTSGVMLDEGGTTAPSADASNPMLILSVKNVADNELGDYAIYNVLMNTPGVVDVVRIGVAGS